MDAKTEAQHRREIADAFDVLAKAFKPLNKGTARGYRSNAKANRRVANELDPPRPEWQDGDLALDREGCLWQHDDGYWYHLYKERYTEDLTTWYGPIRKVHIADPARHEVVVSLDGLDREDLDTFANRDDGNQHGNAHRAVIRAAKAAREQLGEVQ